MTNPWYTNPDKLKSSQYATEKNLSARIYVHDKFSTNPTDYPIWIFDQMLNDFPSNANIVEFGCGNALIWQANTHRIPDGWTITLTDLSQGMLDDAQRNLGAHASRFNFQVVDVQNVPFKDNLYDAVIANFMLYHVPNRPQAIKEMRRILKDTGIVHSVTLGKKHMYEFNQLMEQAVPHYEWRPDALPFNTDNAVNELGQQFGKVDIVPYDSNLRVTEVQPMVEYLGSTARIEQVTHDELATFRQLVEQIVNQDGVWHIQKEVVLFKSTGYAQ